MNRRQIVELNLIQFAFPDTVKNHKHSILSSMEHSSEGENIDKSTISRYRLQKHTLKNIKLTTTNN